MTEAGQAKSENPPHSRELDRKTMWAFSVGEIADQGAYQAFTFLVFTFYYTVVGLNVTWISIGFILFSFWNALNEPFFGVLSDRTKTRWGRRIPWMWLTLGPLAIAMILLFTPPMTGSAIAQFAYFLFIIIFFDAMYNIYSLNHTSLFPEMAIVEAKRRELGNLRRIITIVALIIAFILPTFLITDMTNSTGQTAKTFGQYQLVGVIIGIIIAVTAIIGTKYGSFERPEFRNDSKTAPSFVDSFKYTFKNKSFVTYVLAALANWYVYAMAPTIVPLYGRYVLGITNSIELGVLLLVAFLVGGAVIPLWKRVQARFGVRKTYMINFAVWAVCCLPFLFVDDVIGGLVAMAFFGIGIGGAIYLIDQIIAEVIDEDEMIHGTRREGGFFGINSLVIRLSTVFSFLTIAIVFTGTGWGTYTPSAGANVILGLRFLMGVFPVAALLLGMLALYYYPIKGARLKAIQESMAKIHAEKGQKAVSQ
jgi:GPH family glycoside/pentoside/hexuronide:cation symporter